MTPPWFVYVLRGTRTDLRSVYYVGCTTDIQRRVRQHNGEIPGGAKFTRGSRPWVFMTQYGPYAGRGPAQKAERSVKKLSGPARTRWTPDSFG